MMKKDTQKINNYTNQEIIEFWLRKYIDNQNTYDNYKYGLNYFIRFLVDNKLNWDKLNKNNIIDFKQFLTENTTPIMVKKTFNTLKLMYKDLMNENQLNSNPTLSIKIKQKIYPKQAEYYTITENELSRLIKLAKQYITNEGTQQQLILILTTLFYTGVRVSELVNIKMDDFTFHKNKYYTLKIIGKRNVYGVVAVPYPLEELIKNITHTGYLISHPDARDTIKKRSYINGLLNDFFDVIQPYTKLKLSLITPHTFRRSYATHLFNNGLDIRYINQNMRHASISQTYKYIANLKTKQRYLETVERFGVGTNAKDSDK